MRAPSRLLTCLMLCSASAFAQSTAPGLWEIQNKMGGNPELDQAMAQMQKQMASMPPAPAVTAPVKRLEPASVSVPEPRRVRPPVFEASMPPPSVTARPFVSIVTADPLFAKRVE